MNKTIKPCLYGSTLTELKALCEQLELPRFAAKQIADWLYRHFVTDIDAMTNLSKVARERLKEKTKTVLLLIHYCCIKEKKKT